MALKLDNVGIVVSGLGGRSDKPDLDTYQVFYKAGSHIYDSPKLDGFDRVFADASKSGRESNHA